MLSDSGRLDRQRFVQTHILGGTMAQADNEAQNTRISLHFPSFRPTGTGMEQTEQCLNFKQQQGKT